MAEKKIKPTYPQWDPLKSEDWQGESYSRETMVRIKRYNVSKVDFTPYINYCPLLCMLRDLQVVCEDPPSGICVLPRDENLTTVRSILENMITMQCM